MNKPELILIGGGGHCKSCIDVIEQENNYVIAGIIDVPDKVGQLVLNYPVIGSDKDLEGFSKQYKNFIITLGQIKSAQKRIDLFNKLKELNVNVPTIVSPLAYVSKHAFVGVGSIIFHQVVINAGARIGNNCIINTKALIEHDANVGNHCHISTGSIVNGGVKIGDCSFYGSGAVSKEYIDIPAGSFIKANSIVK